MNEIKNNGPIEVRKLYTKFRFIGDLNSINDGEKIAISIFDRN